MRKILNLSTLYRSYILKMWHASQYIFLTFLFIWPLSTTKAGQSFHKRSIVLNPMGTAIGVIATGFSYSSLSLNGRYQQMLSKQWAFTVSPQFVYSDIATLETYFLGLKSGPRYCLSNRDLDGWYITPMLLAGYGFTYQLEHYKQSAYMVGLGIESGYTWRWDHLIFELGLGLHYSGLIGHQSQFRDESGKVPSFSIGPILNLGIGYAW